MFYELYESYQLFIIFFIYIKMSKNLSAKNYQENKEKLQKRLAKDSKIFLKKKRKNATIWL